MNDLYSKQIIWYIAGFILAYMVMTIGNTHIYRLSWFLYVIGILSLIGLFFFGTTINEATCWYEIKGLGTIQPSEFMKIILIITIASMISKFNEDFPNPSIREEFYFLLKVVLVVLVPSVLTFMQPDTGVVLIYLLITTIMLFISGIRYRWFAILFGICGIFIFLVLGIYFINEDLFIKIFGTSFFLRVDRILDWSNQSGYQLENSLSSIGSAGLFGHGWNKNPIYFPEAQTDFIFAVIGEEMGFIIAGAIIILYVVLITKCLYVAKTAKDDVGSLIASGITGIFVFHMLENIGMVMGLLPITGVPLPFISYGGSSLITNYMMIGILLNISGKRQKSIFVK